MLRRVMGLARPVVDVVIPPRCWAEGTDAGGGMGLSEGTRHRIAVLSAQPFCFHCGLTVGPYEVHDVRDPCGRCGERALGVARMARVGTFSEPLIALVHRLKFGRSWELARILAPFLHQSIVRVSEATRTPVDALLPVPLHWSRRMGRGFNQAEELAREAAALSSSDGWRVVPALRRVRRTHEQARIESPTRRAENLRNAFVARASRRIAGKHVWIVDDVSTTGATLHAAASALRRLPREVRPASINAAVLCVVDHRSPVMDHLKG